MSIFSQRCERRLDFFLIIGWLWRDRDVSLRSFFPNLKVQLDSEAWRFPYNQPLDNCTNSIPSRTGKQLEGFKFWQSLLILLVSVEQFFLQALNWVKVLSNAIWSIIWNLRIKTRTGNEVTVPRDGAEALGFGRHQRQLRKKQCI